MNYYPIPPIEYLKHKLMSNFFKKTKRASEELAYDEIMKDAERQQYGQHNEKAVRWLENLPVPEGGGLLQRLADKDKSLSEFYDLQDPFRRGFMLAEEIVKKWCEENYPLGK